MFHHYHNRMKIFAFTLFLYVVYASQVRFDNFKVIRIHPKTIDQVKALRKLQENNFDYDFWTNGVGLKHHVDIMVPPHKMGDFERFLKVNKLKWEIFIENVQELIDKERARVRPHHHRVMDWIDYYDLPEIYSWMDRLVEEHPGKVIVLSPGKSYEQREIKGVYISFSPENKNNAVFVEGGIHAREWITSAVATYLINGILSNDDQTVRRTVEQYDWYIFPVFNPDGFEYTKQRNRMWRKTRTPYNNCFGADPNRNWDYHWNTGGASKNPCSDTYAGPHVKSEPEVASMTAFISFIQQKLVAYISFHAYGQLLLIPFGHTKQHLDNYDESEEIGMIAANKLRSFFGTTYTVGNSAETLCKVFISDGTEAE